MSRERGVFCVRMLAGGPLLGTIAERYPYHQAHHSPARDWCDTRRYPWLLARAYKRLALKEEHQWATEDGLGIRRCSKQALGWRSAVS